MVDFKIVINDPKTGKSYQKELKDLDSKALIGQKIGAKVKGEVMDMTGYEFELCGGSDFAGFPMRADVKGSLRKKILAVEGIGLSKKGHGIRTRKSVVGNTVGENTAQVNLKIIKYGKEPLEKKEETPKEEKKEAPEGK